MLAQHRQVEPSGRLRVSMPGDFANVVLGALLADFIAKYPAITLEIDLSPAARRPDRRELRRRHPHGRLARRRLAGRAAPGGFSSSLYASPDYLARRGTPPEPEALMEHDALRLLMRNGEPMPWVLTRGEQRWEGIPPGPRHRQFA